MTTLSNNQIKAKFRWKKIRRKMKKVGRKKEKNSHICRQKTEKMGRNLSKREEGRKERVGLTE